MDVSICAGRFKGKKLKFPDSLSDFRPTKLVVREAVCSSIQMDIVDSKVLELCGGSGVFSLELMSRGAESAVVVEIDSKRADTISQFANELLIASSVDIVNEDVLHAIPKISDTFDIIFFDPPYYTDVIAEKIPEVLKLLTPGGVLVFEHATDDSFIETIDIPSGYKIKMKKYGNTTIRYFRSKEFC